MSPLIKFIAAAAVAATSVAAYSGDMTYFDPVSGAITTITISITFRTIC